MAVKRYKTCTIFARSVKDPSTGLETLGDARVYTCSRRQGGSSKLVDSTGSEFYPKSTFWVRESDLISGVHIEPHTGEMIVLGDQSTSTPQDAGAEVVRSVTIHDHTKFGESDSYVIGTGS